MAKNPPKGASYYVGWIPREYAEKLLKNDGDFLVRQTEHKKGNPEFALSVCHKNHAHHYIIHSKHGQYYIKDVYRPNVHELIEYYVYSRQELDVDGAILKRPISKPHNFFTKDQIEKKRLIGEGAFGKVYHGSWRSDGKQRECAIKVLNSSQDDLEETKNQRTKFIKEAEIMLKLSHPNVLHAFGILVDKDPLKIVLEYAPGGSLKTFLKKTPPSAAPVELLSRFCDDAAKGLQYLASQKVIHGDVAARNCLIGYQNELKICDFGLSISGYRSVKLPQLVNMPLKWLPPEAYTNLELSIQSDVWAYGVLLWEIFTRCRSEPYPGLSNEQAREVILSDRLPMEPPPEMPPLYTTVMIRCFDKSPSARADFNEIVKLCCHSDEHSWL